jgi:hypothetical protein
MAKLYPIELRIIRSMLSNEFGTDCPLIPRLELLDTESRTMTGTGYFVYFSNAEELPRLNSLNTELSTDYRTSRDAPCDVVGFTLFIRKGVLSSFEGYAFGDVKWPDEPIEIWLLVNAV